MTHTVSVRLGKDLLKELSELEKRWQTDRSEAVRRLLVEALKSWRMENALEKLKMHKISIGKAAEECGISIWEMLELAKEKNIDWVGYTNEDLEKDIALLR